MSLQVNEFHHIPCENDAEYIKLLKDALRRQQEITSKAVAKIKKLSKELQKYEWIPVDKCEPNKYHVLVTLKWADDDYEVSEIDYGVTKYCAISKDPMDNPELNKKLLDHITAWMPLPEPYKQKEGDYDV